jgi:hypothetical protein
MFFLLISKNSLNDFGHVSYIIYISAFLSIVSRYGGNEYLNSLIHLSPREKKYGLESALSISLRISLLMVFVIISAKLLSFTFIGWEDSFLLVIIVMLQPLIQIIDQKLVIAENHKLLAITNIYKSGLLILLGFFLTSYQDNVITLYLYFIISIISSSVIYFRLINFGKILSAAKKERIFFWLKDNFYYFISTVIYIAPIIVDKIYIGYHIDKTSLANYEFAWKIALMVDVVFVSLLYQLFFKKIIDKISPKLIIYLVIGILMVLIINELFLIEVIKTFVKILNKNYEIDKQIFQIAITYILLNFIINILKSAFANKFFYSQIVKVNTMMLLFLMTNFLFNKHMDVYEISYSLIIYQAAITIFMMCFINRKLQKT